MAVLPERIFVQASKIVWLILPYLQGIFRSMGVNPPVKTDAGSTPAALTGLSKCPRHRAVPGQSRGRDPEGLSTHQLQNHDQRRGRNELQDRKQRGPFKIAGVKEHYLMNIEECFASVPMFWQRSAQSGVIPKLCALMGSEPKGVLGVSTCMNGTDFDYYIAVAPGRETPAGLVDYTVPECTWAIFECVGAMPGAIQELQKRIVGEWLPNSGYEYANAPDIEVYFEGDQQSDDYRCEVWLPVTKKS